MLKTQTKTSKAWLLSGFFALLFCISSLQATIYRYKSSDGTIVFSDQPHQGASQVVLPPVSQYSSSVQTNKNKPLISSNKVKTVNAASQKSVITITSLKNNDTVRNNNTLPLQVTANINPQLQQGEQAQLLVDNKVMAISQDLGRVVSFILKGVNRGAHSLKVVVVKEKTNEQISSSIAIKVYFQQNSVRLLLSSKPGETEVVPSDGTAKNIS
jgi:hypothetical protein